jgi:hypothetical protein
VCVLLDGITHACEHGVLEYEKWVEQCLAGRELFDVFIRQLAELDDMFRLVDRWYAALMRLANVDDEEDFIVITGIAHKLMKQAHETGQL